MSEVARQPPDFVIALLCSAGGLDALSEVLGPLPADLPAAVLALQHISPAYPSLLPVILSRRTDLPVTHAADGAPLTAGQVLIAPPGHHTLVTADGAIALIPAGKVPPYRPSADLLLTTLAIAYGPRVIAVVLSGGGNDAATGATAVHRFGGTVIAASPDTSTHRAMPEATITRYTITDQVAPVHELAALLIALIAAPTLDRS